MTHLPPDPIKELKTAIATFYASLMAMAQTTPHEALASEACDAFIALGGLALHAMTTCVCQPPDVDYNLLVNKGVAACLICGEEYDIQQEVSNV